MSEVEGVGLFIDFDNVRYSLLNERGKEIDPKELMNKAKKYGRVIAAKAYADFSEHPLEFRRSLEVAGIDVRDIPKGSGVLRSKSKKSSPEIAMVLDVFELLLDRPHIGTLVFMTGDRDLIRLVTMARHRFGKQVVISGVPETVSRDLAAAADRLDPLVPPIQETLQAPSALPPTVEGGPAGEASAQIEVSEEETRLIRSIHFHADRPYRSFNFLAEKAASDRNPNRIGDLEQAKLALEAAVREGLLAAEEVDTGMGYSITSYSLNESNPKVRKVLSLVVGNRTLAWNGATNGG